jgi:hypothetical protein
MKTKYFILISAFQFLSLSAFAQVTAVTQDADGLNQDITQPSDITLTLNGTLNGTPAAGTLDLSNLTLSGLLEDIRSLSDPNADRVLAWDDSAGEIVYLSEADFKAAYNLEIGTIASQDADSVAITGGTLSGITSFGMGFNTFTVSPSGKLVLRNGTIGNLVLGGSGADADGIIFSGSDLGILSVSDLSGSDILSATASAFTSYGTISSSGASYVDGNSLLNATALDLRYQALDADLDKLAAPSWNTLTGGSDGDLLLYVSGFPSVYDNVTMSGDATLAGTGALTVVSASTTAAGKIEIATDAEVQTGTDSARAVVPSALAAWWTWIKTQAATISGDWDFTGEVDFTGATITGMDLSTIVLGEVNIGTEDYGWTYNPAVNDGQMEIRFPGGTAAFYETGSPLAPYFYLPGTIEADALVGEITSSNITAAGLSGTIPFTVMENSLGVHAGLMPTSTGQGAGGVTYSGVGLAYGPNPLDARYWASTLVVPGPLSANQTEWQWRTRAQANEDLMPSGTNTVDMSSIAAGGETTFTVTITNPQTNETIGTTNTPTVHLGWSAALETGLVVAQAYVSGTNTVTVRILNTTGGAIDPASITCRASVSPR